jgi:hypothetical protein
VPGPSPDRLCRGQCPSGLAFRVSERGGSLRAAGSGARKLNTDASVGGFAGEGVLGRGLYILTSAALEPIFRFPPSERVGSFQEPQIKVAGAASGSANSDDFR